MFAFSLQSFPYLQRLGHKSLDGATAKATIGRFGLMFVRGCTLLVMPYRIFIMAIKY